MTRPVTVLAAIGALLWTTGACKRPNPAFLGVGDGGSGSGGGVTGTTVAASGSNSGDTSGTSDGGSDTGTTGGACALPVGGRVDISMTIEGDTVPCSPNGGVLVERWALKADGENGKFGLKLCDDASTGCDDTCTSDATLEIAAPPEVVPSELPSCVKVILYGPAEDTADPGDCHYDVLVLKAWYMGAVYPLWMGTAHTADPPTGLDVFTQPLSVVKNPQEPCTCTAVDCCGGVATWYTLAFNIGGLPVATVGPGEIVEVPIVGIPDKSYRIANADAHDQVPCGDPPEIYWAFGDTDFLP